MTPATPGKPALPIDFAAGLGRGLRRALVLGGGGTYFVAWQVAYLDELARLGVPLAAADRIVGTSAGSIVAGVLTAGRVRRVARALELTSHAPGLLSRGESFSQFTSSQTRALDLFRSADDSDPATIREIGRAALAAVTAPPASLRRVTGLAIGTRRWPAPSLHITAVDAYTGERLVLDHTLGVQVNAAAAASSSVPGLFAPQPLLDRYCMDGGVSGSGTHTDLVAGAARVLVLSLSDTFRGQERPGLMTQRPGAYDAELAALSASGSQVLSRGPEQVDLTQLMSPAATPDALAMGRRQARGDAEELRQFWAAPGGRRGGR